MKRAGTRRDLRGAAPSTICFGLGVMLAFAGPAQAEDAEVSEVDAVVVTAARAPASLVQTPSAQVIDRAAIERSGAAYASELLRDAPGLGLYESGAFGGVASVRIRGASSDKTLYLLDGAPLNDPSQPAGGFDLSSLDLNSLERIEILSGPQASLWGSDAIGGVIAFTSRRPSGLQLQAEMGSYGFGRVGLAAGGQFGGLGLSFNGSRAGAEGLSKAASGRERDGFGATSASGAARIDLFEGVALDARLTWSRAETDVDGYPGPLFILADTAERSVREALEGRVAARFDGPFGLRQSVSLATLDLQRGQTGGAFGFGYDASRQTWRWTAERGRPTDHLSLAVGLEAVRERAALSDGVHVDQDATAGFVAARFRPVSRLELAASLRRDVARARDGATTARGSAVLTLGAGWALSLSAGQGFKRPTISQSACDFCFPAGPALGLRPEHADGADLGLSWRGADDRIEGSITLWRLSVRDQIDFAYDPSTFSFRYRNIARTRASGVEARARAALSAGWSLDAAVWATDAEDLSDGRRLLRVPGLQASAGLEYEAAKLSGGLRLRRESSQADVNVDGFSRVSRPGFTTADLHLAWRVNAKVEWTLRVDNLADTAWREVYGFAEPGRSARLGLRLRY